MHLDYPSIAPLVRSSDRQGSVLHVVFQDAQGGPPVQATGTLRRGTGAASATRSLVQSRLLSHLTFAISRAVSGALGDNVVSRAGLRMARSAATDAASSSDLSFSSAEKQAATVEAFESVSSQFRWDGSAWVTDSTSSRAPSQGGDFAAQLEAAPITDPADLVVLGRMLVELSGADGEIGADERTFLGTFLPADLDIDAVAAGPELTEAELSAVTAGPVRETMLMLAWGLSFCDDELADEEQAACRRFAEGLGVERPKGKALRNAAAAFVLEHAFAQAWSGGTCDEELREEAFAAAERLGLARPVAARIEARYKRRNNIA